MTTEIVCGKGGPTAINSNGWLLSGPTESAMSSKTTVTSLIILGTSDSLFDHAKDSLIGILKNRINWHQKGIGNNKVEWLF